jgi:hypothetical protein
MITKPATTAKQKVHQKEQGNCKPSPSALQHGLLTRTSFLLNSCLNDSGSTLLSAYRSDGNSDSSSDTNSDGSIIT